MRLLHVPTSAPARASAVLLSAIAIGILAASTGFGATSATLLPNAQVIGNLSLADPTALGATPPVCTKAISPLDTDGCDDVKFTGGTSKVLSLGTLAGSDVQAGSLRWTVSTTNHAGYRVTMLNAGAAPLLRSGSSSIQDISTTSLVAAKDFDKSTHFGVAMGDPASDAEGSIPASWATTSGQQGERFSGVPVAGMVVAERSTAQTADPFTATFAVASVAGSQPASGAYAGTIKLVASAL